MALLNINEVFDEKETRLLKEAKGDMTWREALKTWAKQYLTIKEGVN